MTEFGTRDILRALVRNPLLRGVVSAVPATRILARRFVAGNDLDDAVYVIRRINARGMEATLNHLGTHVRTLPDALVAANLAIESLDRIHREGIRAELSVKLTQIGLDLSDDVCRFQLDRILERAASLSIFVRIDMEESSYVDRTIAILGDAQHRFGVEAVGIVVQSYLRDAHAQLEHLLSSGRGSGS